MCIFSCFTLKIALCSRVNSGAASKWLIFFLVTAMETSKSNVISNVSGAVFLSTVLTNTFYILYVKLTSIEAFGLIFDTGLIPVTQIQSNTVYYSITLTLLKSQYVTDN